MPEYEKQPFYYLIPLTKEDTVRFNVPILEDKVKNMLLGTYIGDALGLPAETKCYAWIKDNIGRIRHYLPVKPSKYFPQAAPGSTSDDSQLTTAVMRALMLGNGLDMDIMVQQHISSYDQTTAGWGNSTRQSVERLKDDVSWRDSGVTTEEGGGMGNGVIIKMAPLAAHYFLRSRVSLLDFTKYYSKDGWLLHHIQWFTTMTHNTQMAYEASALYMQTLLYCLENCECTFNGRELLRILHEAASDMEPRTPLKRVSFIPPLELMLERMGSDNLQMETAEIIKAFVGTHYVDESLPFSLAFFLRRPHSIEALYDVVSAGGDTDSNGALVGNMLGALNGRIFTEDLVKGFQDSEKVRGLIDSFFKKFYRPPEH